MRYVSFSSLISLYCSYHLDIKIHSYLFYVVHDRKKTILVEEFGEHVQRMHADRDKWFELEYEVRAKTATAGNFRSLVCVVLCLYQLLLSTTSCY